MRSLKACAETRFIGIRQKRFMKHQNIFLSFVLAAGSMLGQETTKPVEKKADEKGAVEKGLTKVGKSVDKAAQKTAEVSKDAGKKTVEVTKSAAAATEKGAKKTVEATKEAGKKTGEVTKDIAKKTAAGAENAAKKTGEVTKEAAKKTASATGSGIEKTGKAIKGTTQLDINSASAADLKREMGVTDAVAAKIIQGRPYKMKSQLASKDILTDAQYEKVKDKIIAKQK